MAFLSRPLQPGRIEIVHFLPLRRVAEARNRTSGLVACAGADPLLSEWERWASELLESHLSYPVLTYYRSQHDNQSWIAALTTILDTTALLITSVKNPDGYQARLTFAGDWCRDFVR